MKNIRDEEVKKVIRENLSYSEMRKKIDKLFRKYPKEKK